MSWRDALKEYSNMNGQYVIPKKGTKQYDEVKAIQDKLKGSPASLVTEPKTTKTTKTTKTKSKKGKGVKETFIKVVQKVNDTIDKNIESVPEDIPLATGEMHAKKIVRKNGKIMKQNYNYAGPGTQVERRLAQNIQPIDGIDAAAKIHDIDYTLNFQKRMKRGEKVSKQEVQMADKKFVDSVKQNKADNPVLATIIPPVFKAKEVAENAGALSHTAFFDPSTGSGVMSDTKLKMIRKKKV
jgi:hypothetical protein